MSTFVSDSYSDEEMLCPAEWYGGYKEARLLSAGDAERPLSDALSGAPLPSTFRFSLDDSDGRFREQFVDPVDRYWSEALSFRMTSRANRAVLGTPFTAFHGFVIDAQPVFPRAWEFTLADVITHGIVSEELNVPWRKIGDGFLPLLDAVSDRLDREQAEPILYGRFTRTTDEESPPSPPAGYPVLPIYLGLQTVDGGQNHCWLVAGHACTSITIQVDGVDTPEGSDWLIATQANWISAFGAPYVDYTSVSGVDRRYSLIYGSVDSEDAEACSLGDKQLTALVEGIEDVGDGSGSLITDYYDQYKHFCINFVVNRGPFGYMSGNWLTNPPWNVTGATTTMVDEDSFDTVGDIAEERRIGGLQGAAAIGMSGGGVNVRQILANWNISGFVRSGQPTAFRIGIVALHPTQAAKDAAPLYTDSYEVIQGSFQTTAEWNRQATAIDYRGDYDQVNGVYRTTGFVTDVEASTNYNRTPRLARDYPYLPGRDQIEHLATLELKTIIHPPLVIRFEQTISEDIHTDNPNWLAYRNSGEYIRYVHFDSIGTRSERLAQVITPYIRGDQRKAGCIAVDCEDLIDFDTET